MSDEAPGRDWATEERISVGEDLAGSEDAGRFGLLYEVGKRLLSASVDELNQLALSLAFESLRAERGALLLGDPETGELVPKLQRHRDKGPIGPDELTVPSSIVGEVVEKRIGILTSDALHDPRFEVSPRVTNAQRPGSVRGRARCDSP